MIKFNLLSPAILLRNATAPEAFSCAKSVHSSIDHNYVSDHWMISIKRRQWGWRGHRPPVQQQDAPPALVTAVTSPPHVASLKVRGIQLKDGNIRLNLSLAWRPEHVKSYYHLSIKLWILNIRKEQKSRAMHGYEDPGRGSPRKTIDVVGRLWIKSDFYKVPIRILVTW